MKKLHKKIGAMALASMIVVGGVGASKIDSHAWWGRSSVIVSGPNLDLSKLSKKAFIDADYLQDYLKYNGEGIKMVAVADGKDIMDDYIKRNHSSLASRVASDCFYGGDVVAIAKAAKGRGEDFVKVKFSDAYVLLSVK